MPEGPEVKTIVDQLNKLVIGQQLLGVAIISGRYSRHDSPSGLDSFLSAASNVSLGTMCKGKFIYMSFLDTRKKQTKFMFNSLGMTGHWSLKEKDHARVVLKFSGFDLFFCDPRNFGILSFDNDALQLENKLQSLGFDLLKDDVSVEMFREHLQQRKNWKEYLVSEALLDQSIFAGVGNYVRSEALYHGELSPHRTLGSLSDNELEKLLASVAHVLRASYACGGMSMSDYADLEGKPGSFADRLLVYRKKSDSLGNVVVREKDKNGRMLHWCKEVQR